MDSLKKDVAVIKEDISEIKITMAVNTKSLETHIARSDAMQEMLAEFKNHMILVNAIVKVVVAAGSILLFLSQLGILSHFIN